MKKRMYFIYNPHAGMERIKSSLSDIIDVFVKAGYEVTVYPTQKKGDAAQAVSEMRDGYDILVCSGGDGTLDEVVYGMRKKGEALPVGYIPAGSTNDFARTLKIPMEMKEAAEAVVSGRVFKCDTGLFNDRTFVYVAAFGLFTDVSYVTEQDLKNTFGHLAYLLEAITRLGDISSSHMKVVYDEVVLEDDFLFGMVSNSLSVAGIWTPQQPDVMLDDGAFEITLVKMPLDPADIGDIAAALISGNPNYYVSFFKAESISFHSEDEVSWTLDGEYGGSHKEVVIENRHRALDIIVPENEEIPGNAPALPE